MKTHLQTHGAMPNWPENDKAPAVAAARGFTNQEQNERLHFQAECTADQAAPMLAGENCALSYLDRLPGGTAQPGELSALFCYLRGKLLHGACRLIEKALEGRRHA